MEKKPNKKQASKWLALIISLKWVLLIFLFVTFKLFDENYPSPKVYYIRFLSWWAFLALYNVHRQVNEINKSLNSPLELSIYTNQHTKF
jgi:glucan phosphoethanolaminetransferase (alkaline phosphatase superfamily)